MKNDKITNRGMVVLGAILIQLALGAIYAWSVFTPTLVEEGWSKSNTQWVFAIGLASFAVFMVFAGKKLTTWGPQRLAWAGGITLGFGYLCAGIFGGTDFWAILLLIGLVGGAGIGFAYVVPIAVGIRWFPDKKGMITGLAVAGFGFGALLWVKLAGSWGDLIEMMGLGFTFMTYGIAFAALVFIGGIWMRFPPEGWAPKGYEATTATAVSSQHEFSSSEMLKRVQFYLIFFTFVFSAGAGLMSIGLMKLYPMEALQAAGIPEMQASAIAGTAMAVFFSLANGIGRIVWGLLSDKLGRKNSIVIMTATQGIIVILFTYMAGNEVLLYLGATLIGFNFGGNFALFPTITADTFGAKNVGLNYPWVFLSYGVGGILGPILGGKLGDVGNFSLAFTISGIAVLVGTVLTLMIKPAKKEEAGSSEIEREKVLA